MLALRLGPATTTVANSMPSTLVRSAHQQARSCPRSATSFSHLTAAGGGTALPEAPSMATTTRTRWASLPLLCHGLVPSAVASPRHPSQACPWSGTGGDSQTLPRRKPSASTIGRPLPASRRLAASPKPCLPTSTSLTLASRSTQRRPQSSVILHQVQDRVPCRVLAA